MGSRIIGMLNLACTLSHQRAYNTVSGSSINPAHPWYGCWSCQSCLCPSDAWYLLQLCLLWLHLRWYPLFLDINSDIHKINPWRFPLWFFSGYPGAEHRKRIGLPALRVSPRITYQIIDLEGCKTIKNGSAIVMHRT